MSCERLGLAGSTEAAVRKEFPRNTGMLVVTEVQPGSPSEKVLQPGDILVRLNGHYVGRFEPLEEVLDDSVGGKVEVELERGGKTISAQTPGRGSARDHARAPTSSSATRSCTRSPTSRRDTSTCRSAGCTSPTPATCSAPPVCRAGR